MSEEHRIKIVMATKNGTDEVWLTSTETVALIQQQESDMWVFADGEMVPADHINEARFSTVTSVNILPGLVGGQSFPNILIIGAGGIGGNLAERLSRAIAFTEPHRITLTIMDGDIVEERNLPHQPFAVGDLGKHKVDAIVHNLQKIGITDDRGVRLIPVEDNLSSDTDLSGYDIVVVAVDRETPRRIVRENAENWLDLRATGDGFLMLTHEAPQSRINSIPSDENAPPASCQRPGAIESGNIQFGFSEAASHGAEWIVQWLNDRRNLPSSRMYYLHTGQRTFPSMIIEEAEE